MVQILNASLKIFFFLLSAIDSTTLAVLWHSAIWSDIGTRPSSDKFKKP